MIASQEISAALQLWSDYVSAKQALLDGGFIRSFKSAEADLAEWLVAQVFQGELTPSKCHPCKATGNPNGYIITEKDRSNNASTGATHYAFVFFDNLVPTIVYLVPEAFVRQWGKAQIKRFDLENSTEAIRKIIETT
jgi:hypothetical protein